MSAGAVRVIKLGGSLLDWPEWVEPFRRWLARQAPAANVLVAGGGSLVDSIRQLDRSHTLGDEASHRLAVRAMSLTADVAATLLGIAKPVRCLDRLSVSPSPEPQVFDVEDFVAGQQSASDPLPCNWNVTSDSIAARVARVLDARELVLLKSTLPRGADLPAWVAEGFVDAYFVHAADGLTVRGVNLRDPQLAEVSVGGEV